ncbi:hypothetical protein KY358_06745 [Candidatus Woesearchaeota archaeon]|nr:hypothetical protein [Candidatus Woesearchaeota archaeon]
MAGIDKEELKKLTPSERIKRLKKIEEESKKEIEEAEKLIHETESQIEKDNIAESVKVPETGPVDISRLFKEEEGLESAVKKSVDEDEKDKSQLYQLAQAYEEVKSMYQSDDKLDEKQLEWIDKLGEKIEKARYETLAKEVANLAVATRSIIYKIRKYHQQEGRFL